MKVNLFVNFYQDKQKARQNELLTCVLANIYNSEIDTVNLLVENKDNDSLKKFLSNNFDSNKVNIIPFEGRPTYNDYFSFTKKYPDDINIVSNKDMVMDVKSLRRLKSWDWKNYCIAISRWDFINDDLNIAEAERYDHADSQDTWMVKGSFPQIVGADFGLGNRGCDNAIAYLLTTKYQVINPSIDIKSYHYHLTGIRNYIDKNGNMDAAIPPPYHLPVPIKLP